jgi:choline dehydrogenase-like flavoprotein
MQQPVSNFSTFQQLAIAKYIIKSIFLIYTEITGYHAAGTCAMRLADDGRGVVDEELLVRQVENLRVADCSIMPTLPGGHTQMPAYAIGEKCADLIKSTWN